MTSSSLVCSTRIIPITAYTKRGRPTLHARCKAGHFHIGLRLDVERLRRPSEGQTLRVQSSDDCPRAKPSGFRAPTTVRGQNPQGSELRRPSEGKTLRVQGSDDRPRAKPSGFRAPTTVQERRTLPSVAPFPYFCTRRDGLRRRELQRSPIGSHTTPLLPRVLEHHVKNKIDEK